MKVCTAMSENARFTCGDKMARRCLLTDIREFWCSGCCLIDSCLLPQSQAQRLTSWRVTRLPFHGLRALLQLFAASATSVGLSG